MILSVLFPLYHHLCTAVSPSCHPRLPACLLPTTAAAAAAAFCRGDLFDVYVLELEQQHVYVGRSTNVQRRLIQHMTGKGAQFTRHHRKPTGKLLPRLGNLVGDGDGPERDETLRQMEKRGPDMVRGWKYCHPVLSEEDRREIESNLRELLNLCRRCGKPGHFARRCWSVVDRHGKPIS